MGTTKRRIKIVRKCEDGKGLGEGRKKMEVVVTYFGFGQ